MTHADYLIQRGRAKVLRATHPADFSDTLIVDEAAAKPPVTKADEAYMATSDDINALGNLVVVWVSSVLLVVLIVAIVTGAL